MKHSLNVSAVLSGCQQWTADRETLQTAKVCNITDELTVMKLDDLIDVYTILLRYLRTQLLLSTAFCKKGFYSPTGLEGCYPCEKGTFQNQTGHTKCHACGQNMTTPGDGFTNSSDCAGINQFIRSLIRGGRGGGPAVYMTGGPTELHIVNPKNT